MAIFPRVSALCVALSAVTVFVGCSKKNDNWLIGKWAFDPEATKANLPADTRARGIPGNMAKMASQLTTQLMHQMNSCKLQVTAEKFTVIYGNRIAESFAYKIIKRPDANTMVIVGKDSEPATYTKSGKYICLPTTGAVQFKMYFKPVN